MLGRRVLGCQEDHTRLARRGPGLDVEQFGDPKIEQLHHAVVRYEDILGLDVTVHDELAVRMRHSREDVQKQLGARFQTERTPIAIGVDRFTLDVFEDEIGLRGFENAGIEQAGNVGVIQSTEKVALSQEASFSVLADPRRMHELDGDGALEATICAVRSPYTAHTATADLRINHI